MVGGWRTLRLEHFKAYRILAVEEVSALHLPLWLLQPPVAPNVDVLGLVPEPVQVALKLVADEGLEGRRGQSQYLHLTTSPFHH